ncbi:MAG: CvpA family protein, partial [Eubacteriales bacterium]|nr:CvpA family protein [Eubacteriales bacterium]
FQIISFLAVVIGIRLLFILLSSLFGKKRNKGITGFVDGFFGLIVGMLKGAILVFLLLALLVPVIGLSGGDFLADSLRDSSIASTLYDNNLILLIIKDLL